MLQQGKANIKSNIIERLNDTALTREDKRTLEQIFLNKDQNKVKPA